MTLAAKVGKGGKVALAGKITAGGVPAPSVKVVILSGAKKIASATTNAAGTYLATVKLKKGSYSLRATAAAADRDVTAQGCALVPATLPKCVSATAAGAAAASKAVKVRVK